MEIGFFQLLQAKSYLIRLAFKTDKELHQEHLFNAFDHLNSMDVQLHQAKVIIRDREELISDQGIELRELRLKVSKLENENVGLSQALTEQEITIERLSDNLTEEL